MLTDPAVAPRKILPIGSDIEDMTFRIKCQRHVPRGKHEAHGIGRADAIESGLRPIERRFVRKGAFGFYHGGDRP
ncbi:hypothetical protein NSE01_07920 [Novosphingobium sediminis]|uniref:Uncharacterized protein n=1 Tax=Novosphingobium sediminis TaxID=707214 RepID=A0A512AGX3_9SPHN|nr:hypothetical protein NSE01_07920 [Novosphingobium sediminis]